MDLISVIIPTKNRKTLLSITLDNILEQTYPNFEVIVVDDHSSDGTIEFLKMHYGDKVKAISNIGTGPGAARNTGLSQALGKYIKFFDSDDLMSPNTLAIQHEELQKTNSGFLYSPYLYARQEADKWVSTENTILNYYPFDSRKTLNHWMVRGLFLAIPAMLFRRDLINEVGPWSEQTTAYEDWDYCWRLGLAEPKPTHTNKCIFLYRQHGLQSTLHNSDDVKRDKEAIYVFEKILRENFKLYSTSVIESIWFKTKLYKILKKHKAEKFFYERFKRYNIPLYESFLLFDRLINKWQRSKTKSMWPGFYGPETSPHIINAYLATFTFTP